MILTRIIRIKWCIITKKNNHIHNSKTGTRITFEKEGDEAPNTIPGDIVFVVTAKEHERFEREGDDLITTVPVTLEQAMSGVRMSVRGIDGKNITINEPFVTPQTIKVFAGEGMPNQKTPDQRGALRVKFDVRFPQLTSTQRSRIVEVVRGGAA